MQMSSPRSSEKRLEVKLFGVEISRLNLKQLHPSYCGLRFVFFKPNHPFNRSRGKLDAPKSLTRTLLRGMRLAMYIVGQERRLVNPPSQVVAGVRTVTTNMNGRDVLPRLSRPFAFSDAFLTFLSNSIAQITVWLEGTSRCRRCALTIDSNLKHAAHNINLAAKGVVVAKSTSSHARPTR